MDVPAVVTLDCASLDARVLAIDRQDDLVDDVPRALVIDDASRAELADREETGAGQEFVGALLLLAPGQEG